jgi:hypothetical protein
MHLLLGDSQDLFCGSVRDSLEQRGYRARIVSNPLVQPARLSWRLDNQQSSSQLAWDEEPPIPDDQIASVLVRSNGWIDSAGWEPDDLSYMQAETQAALLAWLWSLACPVVNRYPAALWYRPHVPLLSWCPMLRRCGLPTLEMLVTNVAEEARAFGRSLDQAGMGGAVYGPLTGTSRYLVSTEEEWSGVAALQRSAPVCLAQPHGAGQLVCVVGEQVIWDGDPSAEAAQLAPALRAFAKAAGLDFVELALAAGAEGICVIAVEPRPRVECFGDAARQKMVEAMVQLLTAERPADRADAFPALQKSAE